MTQMGISNPLLFEYEKLIEQGLTEDKMIEYLQSIGGFDGFSRFKAITNEMANTYHIKNRDYGSSFDRSLDEHGLLAALIRMKDKIHRFENLIDNDALVTDESLRDTLKDLAGYTVMTIMYLDEKGRMGDEEGRED